MDIGLMGAFSRSATRTFEEMFALEAKASVPRELGPSEDHAWDLTALVGLAGGAQGVMAIRLTRELAAKLLAHSGMAGSCEAESSQLEGGIVGELANIVAGSAASSLTEINVEIAPPVVVRGPNHKISWPAIGPVYGISYSTPSGPFELDLCVRG